MGCSSGPDIIQDGLVLCLDAANKRSYGGSGTTWTDIAESRSAIMTNGISYSDSNAGYLLFDGSNEYIYFDCAQVKYENWKDGKMSLTVVFKQIGLVGVGGGKRAYVVDFRRNGGTGGAFALYIDNESGGKELVSFFSSNPWQEKNVLEYDDYFNTWVHYTITFDKSTSTNNIKHYINGSLVQTDSAASSSSVDSGDRIYIGDYSDTNNSAYQFNGYISLLTVNTGIIFTPEQVRQNYLSTKERFA